MTESEGGLDLLGVLECEISISRLIGAALKRSPVALDILTGRPGQREDLEVHRERAFALQSGRSRRAGLLATGWQDRGPHALVVEHKLFAGEGVDQSVDYAAARDLFAGWAKDRFPDLPGKAAEVSIVMLTLLGDLLWLQCCLADKLCLPPAANLSFHPQPRRSATPAVRCLPARHFRDTCPPSSDDAHGPRRPH